MRLFTSVIIILTLIVSIFPCCLFDECSNASAEACDNACSPFLSCQSCSGIALLTEAFSLSTSLLSTKAIIATVEDLLLHVLSDVWRPPKLSQ